MAACVHANKVIIVLVRCKTHVLVLVILVFSFIDQLLESIEYVLGYVLTVQLYDQLI